MQLADAGSGKDELDLALYDSYSAHIYSYIYRKVAHAQDAEDITLEVFIAAYKSRRQLVDLSTERQLAWLQRVASNKIVDHYRRTTRVTLLPLEHIEHREEEDLSVEQQIIRQESYERLHQVLATLPPLQQQIIRLRFVEGLRCTEIGEIVKKKESHIRTIVSRTLRQLRKIYEQK
ncbi:RNA polymerase sigma factor [Ktedonospora formicarum]|uniref:Uncharacterized protein n=1 Tax=Ktedonospora formicarum TaxID=2778364 RepID=A0A8J3I007_9CHLR|nr:RNA polymerase sigma factor [Ktedonospora formicarum]GHO44280.1 hypothetical protein KSX_24430 [Ktedonospora formicarum]